MPKQTPNLKGMRYLTDIKNILNELRKSPRNTKKNQNNENEQEIQNKNSEQPDSHALGDTSAISSAKEDNKQCPGLLNIRIKELELENARLIKYSRKKDYFQSTGTIGRLLIEKDKKIEQLTQKLHESEQKETNARLINERTLREHLDTVQNMKQYHEQMKKDFNLEIEKIKQASANRPYTNETVQKKGIKCINTHELSKYSQESAINIENTDHFNTLSQKQNKPSSILENSYNFGPLSENPSKFSTGANGSNENNPFDPKKDNKIHNNLKNEFVEAKNDPDKDRESPYIATRTEHEINVADSNEKKHTDIANTYKNSEKEYKSRINHLNMKISEYKKELEDLNEKIVQCQKEIASQTAVSEKLNDKLDHKNAICERQKVQIEKSSNLLQERDKIILDKQLVIDKYHDIIKQCYDTIDQCYNEIRALKTETYRLKTKILELQSNIQVFVRLKPSKENALSVLDNKITVYQNNVPYKFSFDRVYSHISQSDLFFDLSYLLHGFVQGWNVCLFAYGQTGSGKTYTILGEQQSQGILPRAVDYIYEYLDAHLNKNTRHPILEREAMSKELDPNIYTLSRSNDPLNIPNMVRDPNLGQNLDMFDETLKKDSIRDSLENKETVENDQISQGCRTTQGSGIQCGTGLNISERIQKDFESTIKRLSRSRDTDIIHYSLELKILEIYNETVRDLIENQDLKANELDKSGKKIRNKQQMMEMITDSMQKRRTETTKCNTRSSRSHTIYSIRLRQEIRSKKELTLGPVVQTRNCTRQEIAQKVGNSMKASAISKVLNETDHKDLNNDDIVQNRNVSGIGISDNGPENHDKMVIPSPNQSEMNQQTHIEGKCSQREEKGVYSNDLIVIESVFNFIDLAGSERVKSSGVEGIRLKETQFINKSLLNLRMVFSSLINNQLVPYRDSKLTIILKQVLEKKCKTVMLCNVSCESANLNESLCTLRFGQMAEKVNIGRGERNITKE